MKQYRLVTAESVRAGHPDKFCDQIADSILDAYLRKDPHARVAVEAMITDGKLLIAGEVTSAAQVKITKLVTRLIRRIGYGPGDLCENPHDPLELEVRLHEQSPDISDAVGQEGSLGAGDQGVMVGYATDETLEFLPLPVVLAHRICRELDRVRPLYPWMGADGKAQVTVAYDGDHPDSVTTVVVSAQHSAVVDRDTLARVIERDVLPHAIPEHLMRKHTNILINPSGRFIAGGPVADTGLTGRKLAVDQYGPAAHVGGGALSGKDPTKVDRSGAYAARWVAKNIVAAGLAKRCEVQIAYAIGRAEPVSVSVNTFGTGLVAEDVLINAIKETFDLRPAAIIRDLDLRRPIYKPLAVYGHYGRPDLQLPWEATDRKVGLMAAALNRTK